MISFGYWEQLTQSEDWEIERNGVTAADTGVGKWTIIASDNGLSPGRRQAII